VSTALALAAVVLTAVTPSTLDAVHVGDTRRTAETTIGSHGWYKVTFWDERGREIKVRWYSTGDPLARASVLYRVGKRHDRVQSTQWCTRPAKGSGVWTCGQVTP